VTLDDIVHAKWLQVQLLLRQWIVGSKIGFKFLDEESKIQKPNGFIGSRVWVRNNLMQNLSEKTHVIDLSCYWIWTSLGDLGKFSLHCKNKMWSFWELEPSNGFWFLKFGFGSESLPIIILMAWWMCLLLDLWVVGPEFGSMVSCPWDRCELIWWISWHFAGVIRCGGVV